MPLGLGVLKSLLPVYSRVSSGVARPRAVPKRGLFNFLAFMAEAQPKKIKMTDADLIRPFKPPVHRGMKELDREAFQKKIQLVAAKLKDVSYFTSLGKSAKNDLLQLQGVSRIIKLKEGDSESKAILLRQDITSPDNVLSSISASTAEILEMAGATFVPYTLQLSYDYWRAEEIIEAIMPEELVEEVPSGFTVVGHIAHLNIRDQYLPYRFLIGQIIIDKNPLIETVVNKLDSIDTVYRTFDMEVLAGKDDFEVEQSESGCRFRFNFKHVYWNSRLHTEHGRLIDKFAKGEAVCDVFAGVGPFAVPAGRKGVLVFANDLNPNSFKALVENIKLNKDQTFVYPYNEDGRQFIKDSSKLIVQFGKEHPSLDLFPRRVSRSKPVPPDTIPVPRSFNHYVMNLPDTAIEFLDGFIGLYSDAAVAEAAFGSAGPTKEQMPMIHVHCFYKHDPDSPDPEPEQIHEDLRSRISKSMQFEIAVSELSFHKVRKVAPTKTMFCVSYRLPLEVALTE